jgi:hypothetical protein
MHLHDALAAFTLQLEADGRSIHTRRQYARHLRLFGSWLAANGIPAELDGITTQVVARFLTSDAARMTADGAVKLATSTNALRTSEFGLTAGAWSSWRSYHTKLSGRLGAGDARATSEPDLTKRLTLLEEFERFGGELRELVRAMLALVERWLG